MYQIKENVQELSKNPRTRFKKVKDKNNKD